ncbi:MAG: ABC transporter permease [Ferruginibacter sp.]
MLKNYFKIAWRNILKHKFHSLLNILGLAFGMGFTMLIAAYVWSELQVNRQLKHIDRQYIIQTDWKNPDMGLEITTIGPLVKAVAEEYPSLIKNFYRWDGITSNVSNGDKVFREGLQIGDSSFLKMYGFPLLYGNESTALKDPFSVVITEDKALKYFGRKDVVGESLTIESFTGTKHAFTVGAVLKSLPYNSVNRITFDNDNQLFVPAAAAGFFSRSVDDWDNPYIAGFLELQEGVKPESLVAPLQRLIRERAPAETAANMRPYLAPLRNYYLEQNKGLVRKMLITVSLVALFILFMAIINFINISIGKSSVRIKEIGLRKVLGGRRGQIVFQLLSESIVLTLLAALLALGIYSAGNPFLSEVLGKPVPKLYSFPVYFSVLPLLFVLVVGILAGVYPAFMLSALRTAAAVKGKLQTVNSNIRLRKMLVGFQFCSAAVVLIASVILTRQVSLFFSSNLGYDKEFIVAVQTPRNWSQAGVQHMETIRSEFEHMPQVSGASLTWSVPDGKGSGTTAMYPEGKDSTQAYPYESLIADEKYLSLFNIPLLAGRSFRGSSDSLRVVINTAAVRTLGLKHAEEAIGKRLYLSANQSLEIIGVTGDFHFGSMKDKIRPLAITHVSYNRLYRLLCFKLRPGPVGESMNAIQKKWTALMPGTSFEYKFMDESLKFLYRTEIQLKKASQVATALALIIVVLGIVGLVSLSVQKRTKEIGVRKVLGATFMDVASLFLKDTLPVMLTGALIAVPISWYLMDSWLKEYTYRIAITAAPFALSIMALGLITGTVILLQVLKAASANPVKSLRTE